MNPKNEEIEKYANRTVKTKKLDDLISEIDYYFKSDFQTIPVKMCEIN